MDAMRRAETSRIKAFLSRRNDHYRPSYGRHSEDHLRQCVFAGTVNHSNYLTDETGNRRFWPVRVHRVDIEALHRDRDLLWGEARTRYECKETWYLDSADEVQQATEERNARWEPDEWENLIVKWLRGHTYQNSEYEYVTMGEILSQALELEKSKWERKYQTRVGIIMSRLGWEKRQIREGTTRCYVCIKKIC